MARVFTEGFELAASSVTGFWTTIGTNAAASTTSVRPGGSTYSFFCSSTGSVKTFTGLSELYLRFGTRFSGSAASICILANGAQTIGSIRWDGVNRLTIYNGSTLVGTSSMAVYPAVWYLVELHFKIDDSNGIIELRIDGVDACSASGDTHLFAPTTIDRISFIRAPVDYLDDMAMNDTTGTEDNSWCGDGHIIALVPNAAGDVTGLTSSAGNNYACVDEIPHTSDTDYVESATADLYDLYNVAPFTPTNVTIKRVWANAVCRDTVAAGGLMQVGLKTEGNEYWSSSQPLLTTYGAPITTDVYTTNPYSGSQWTASQLADLQIGVKVK